MQDAVAVCNKALLMLRADTITALSDNTDRARLCNGLWDSVRQRVYRLHPWNALRAAQTFTAPGMNAGAFGAGLSVIGNYTLYASATLAGHCALALAQSNFPTLLLAGTYYFETEVIGVPPGGSVEVGVAATDNALSVQLGTGAQQWAYLSGGNKRNNGANSSYGASYTKGDIIGCLLDIATGTITFYKNGTTQGTAFTGIAANSSAYLLPAVGITPTSTTGGLLRGRFLASEWQSTPSGGLEWPAPSFDGEWPFVMTLPAECMRVIAVTDAKGRGLEWKVRARQVLCEQQSVQIRYTKDETVIASVEPYLAEVLVLAMASDMAYALTGSATLANEMRDRYERELQRAKAADGLEETPEAMDDFPLLRVRGFS